VFELSDQHLFERARQHGVFGVSVVFVSAD
jgi:hypothetical protein